MTVKQFKDYLLQCGADDETELLINLPDRKDPKDWRLGLDGININSFDYNGLSNIIEIYSEPIKFNPEPADVVTDFMSYVDEFVDTFIAGKGYVYDEFN